jgi:D-alanyl-lipoteichoic acid acyltransferase DltB (MBOAT superfamily)
MYVNIMITMLLGGLWHGASWNFVFWGGLHGAALAIHKGWVSWNPLARLKANDMFDAAWSFFSRVLTLGVVLLGWIFFRAAAWSLSMQYLSMLLKWHGEWSLVIDCLPQDSFPCRS